MRDLRRRIDRVASRLHTGATADECERQLTHAMRTGVPPTDRDTLARFEAAREAFAVLGGGHESPFFVLDGGATSGTLLTVATQAEMEDANRALRPRA